MREYFNDRPGFSGVNHMLTTIMIFLLLLLIPIEPFSGFLKTMISSPVTGVIAFFLIVGASLLPDLDNLKQDGGGMALWQLGFIGSILSSVMVTISSIMTSIFKTKKDNLPPTQHRMFWHTLLIPIIIFLLIFFFVPSNSEKISQYGSIISNITLIICIALVLFIGVACLIKKIPMVTNNVAQMLGIVLALSASLYIWFGCDMNSLKMFLYCIALGYLAHLVGDLFADTGIPLFPICYIWSGQFWKRFCFLGPMSVKTGSTMEGMLKILFLGIDIVLFILVFIGASFFGDIATMIENVS